MNKDFEPERIEYGSYPSVKDERLKELFGDTTPIPNVNLEGIDGKVLSIYPKGFICSSKEIRPDKFGELWVNYICTGGGAFYKLPKIFVEKRIQ